MQKHRKPCSRDNVLVSYERKMLVEACNKAKERLITKMLLSSGMRISEFLHMQKSWINPSFTYIKIPRLQKCSICTSCREKEIWHVHKNKQTGEVKKSLWKPKGYWSAKTSHAKRLIKIDPSYRDLLKRYFDKYNTIMEKYKNRVYCWEMIKKIGLRAGIKHRIFPHCLRSTNATILASRLNPIELCAKMGWKDLQTALSYVNFSEEGMDRLHEEKLKGVSFCG
jgi:site-specific recombinase XerD